MGWKEIEKQNCSKYQLFAESDHVHNHEQDQAADAGAFFRNLARYDYL